MMTSSTSAKPHSLDDEGLKFRSMDFNGHRGSSPMYSPRLQSAGKLALKQRRRFVNCVRTKRRTGIDLCHYSDMTVTDLYRASP